MKKLFASFALMCICQVAFCQKYTDVIDKFKDFPGAEFTDLPSSLLFVSMEDADPHIKSIFKTVDCMKILDLESCDETIRNDFIAQTKKLEKKYKKYGEENDVVIFYEGSKESAKAAIVVFLDMRDCGMMVLEGKLSISQLEMISEDFLTKEEESVLDERQVEFDDVSMREPMGLEGADNIDIDTDIMTLPPPPPPMEPKPGPVIENKIYSMAEVGEYPEFPGGDPAMYQWLSENLVYPPKAQENGIQGTVVVSFTIGVDGSVTNVKVARGKDPALDYEAVRVVRLMPKWKPGKVNGKPVPIIYTLPVKFQFTEPEKEQSNGQ